MHYSPSNKANGYKGLTVERVKREEIFENLSDEELHHVIRVLEKYSIQMFPGPPKTFRKERRMRPW
jgi:hypothetical protein